MLGVLSCSRIEQDIHELLTWVQRPKADFILCPPRLKMEVAGGKRKGESRQFTEVFPFVPELLMNSTR